MQTLVNQLRHIKEVTSGFLKRLSWLDILILGLLLLFEVSMHPLGIGPDRRIHDPGVARFIDPQSFPQDWYANSVEESGVYSFYGPLVALGPILSIDEERWRMMLYIGSLIILYGSLIRIARVFARVHWWYHSSLSFMRLAICIVRRLGSTAPLFILMAAWLHDRLELLFLFFPLHLFWKRNQ